MIKGFVFDLGGVVVHPKVELIESLVSEYIGVDVEKFIFDYKSDILKGKVSLLDVYSKLADNSGIDFSGRAITDKHLEIFKEIIKELNYDIVSLIEKLRSKYFVACLTNAESDVVSLVRERGIYDYFEKSFISALMGMKKPDKEIYYTVLKNIGFNAREVVGVDDKKECVDVLNSLGIVGIHYKWGDNLGKRLENLVK